MDDKKSQDQRPNQLRRDAETRLRLPRIDVSAMQVDETARLVYELQVHQEELKIQNEELRRVHLELKESRDRYLDLYEFAPVGYLTLNARGEIVEANLTACGMLGYVRSGLISRRLTILCDADSRAELRSHLDEVFSDGKRLSVELGLGADEERTVHLESCRVTDPNDDHQFCRIAMVDITDRKRAERKLREQENQLAHIARVNMMGEMLAGIAHEINQPLQAISNFATACSFALQKRPADQTEELCGMIRQIADEAVRSGDIIRRLREFVRRTEPSREPLRIRDVIAEAVKLTTPETSRRKVAVQVDLATSLPEVPADRVQVAQVLVNLIKNAYEAMDTNVGQRLMKITARASEEGIEVAIADEGEGLSPEMTDSLFEAFRSTKTDGMGLGLAISRSIIETHGGRIWTTPNSAQGTVLHFTLPTRTEVSSDGE